MQQSFMDIQTTVTDYMAPGRLSLPVVVAVEGWSLFQVKYVWSPSFLAQHQLRRLTYAGGLPWFNEMGNGKQSTK